MTDLAALPPLHPSRVEDTLNALLQQAPLTSAQLDTCRCALAQIARGQRVLGMTPERVDTGMSLARGLDALLRLGRKRV